MSELVGLRWDQVDFEEAVLHVTRSKNGTPSNHPLGRTELKALRRLRRGYAGSTYVFATERKGPMTASNVRKILARAGRLAGLPFPVHPHCAMPAGTSSRTTVTIPGPSNITWGIRTSCIPCGTRSSRRIGSKGSGTTDGARQPIVAACCYVVLVECMS